MKCCKLSGYFALGWLLQVDLCAWGGKGTPCTEAGAHIFGNAAEACPALLSREVPLGPHAAWLVLHPFVPEQRSLKVKAAQILALLSALITKSVHATEQTLYKLLSQSCLLLIVHLRHSLISYGVRKGNAQYPQCISISFSFPGQCVSLEPCWCHLVSLLFEKNRHQWSPRALRTARWIRGAAPCSCAPSFPASLQCQQCSHTFILLQSSVSANWTSVPCFPTQG